MKLKILLLFIFFPIIALGQKPGDFNNLVEKINHCLLEYVELSPFGAYNNYCPVEDFGLSKQEMKELIKDADSKEVLSANKDSIQESYMIEFFQNKIVDYFDSIIKHPDFFKNDINNLIKEEDHSIVISDDNKLLNFSFDEQTGGTYRSQISKMYYVDADAKKVIDLNQTDKSVFADDGYNAIYALHTTEGTKYVLTGSVRTCTSCLLTYVQLLRFSGSEFIEEFALFMESRGNGSVAYEHEGKTIYIDYDIDDLTSYCYGCEKEFNYDELEENQRTVHCYSKLVFDGKSFELRESHWEIIENEN